MARRGMLSAMGFFDAPPPPAPQRFPEYRPPAWMGAPDNAVGGATETRVEVDARPLRAASERAIALWPDDRPDPPPDGAACFAR